MKKKLLCFALAWTMAAGAILPALAQETPYGTAAEEDNATGDEITMQRIRHSFGDVALDAYYNDAVSWALEKGITAGTTENTFAPMPPAPVGRWRLSYGGRLVLPSLRATPIPLGMCGRMRTMPRRCNGLTSRASPAALLPIPLAPMQPAPVGRWQALSTAMSRQRAAASKGCGCSVCPFVMCRIGRLRPLRGAI